MAGSDGDVASLQRGALPPPLKLPSLCAVRCALCAARCAFELTENTPLSTTEMLLPWSERYSRLLSPANVPFTILARLQLYNRSVVSAPNPSNVPLCIVTRAAFSLRSKDVRPFKPEKAPLATFASFLFSSSRK